MYTIFQFKHVCIARVMYEQVKCTTNNTDKEITQNMCDQKYSYPAGTACYLARSTAINKRSTISNNSR